MKRSDFLIVLVLLLSIIPASTFLTSCDKEEDYLDLIVDGEHVNEGTLTFSYEGGSKRLTAIHNADARISVTIDYSHSLGTHWLSIDYWQRDDGYGIEVQCDNNQGTVARKAIVRIQVGNASRYITVYQDPKPTSQTDKNSYVIESNGAHVDIRMKANGKVSTSLTSDQPRWLTYDIIEEEGDSYILSCDINENTGLGRAAFINIYVNGTTTEVISFRQKPAVLPSSVTINTAGPGQLFVLFGDERYKLLPIRHLTITGSLNALDLHVLKQFSISGLVGTMNPIDIDLSWTNIYSSRTSWYPNLPVDFSDQIPYIVDNTLPKEMFCTASNLQSIRLPFSLRIIENKCFFLCHSLKEIEIPDEVVSIENYAFSNCRNLTRIEISPNSRLRQIWTCAFSTDSHLSNLYIPTSADQIHKEAFRDCKVDTLQLDIPVPPQIDYGPRGKVLIVPMGSKEAYEAAPNWNRFEKIEETDYIVF